MRRAKVLLVVVAFGLLVNGLTVFWLPWETRAFVAAVWGDAPPQSGIHAWFAHVRDAVADVEARHPKLFYGLDWLGYAHIILAILFLGAARDPVRNEWVIRWGLIACGLVVVHALIFVPIRGLPWWWIFVDSSFGVAASIPLGVALRDVRRLRATSWDTSAARTPPAAS